MPIKRHVIISILKVLFRNFCWLNRTQAAHILTEHYKAGTLTRHQNATLETGLTLLWHTFHGYVHMTKVCEQNEIYIRKLSSTHQKETVR